MTMRMLNHVSYGLESFSRHMARHQLRAPGTFPDLELTPDLLRPQHHLTQGILHGFLRDWRWAGHPGPCGSQDDLRGQSPRCVQPRATPWECQRLPSRENTQNMGLTCCSTSLLPLVLVGIYFYFNYLRTRNFHLFKFHLFRLRQA